MPLQPTRELRQCTVPGCGPVDYEWGVKHGLEIYSPVTADGRYTEQVVPVSLSGISIADAQGRSYYDAASFRATCSKKVHYVTAIRIAVALP